MIVALGLQSACYSTGVFVYLDQMKGRKSQDLVHKEFGPPESTLSLSSGETVEMYRLRYPAIKGYVCNGFNVTMMQMVS